MTSSSSQRAAARVAGRRPCPPRRERRRQRRRRGSGLLDAIVATAVAALVAANATTEARLALSRLGELRLRSSALDAVRDAVETAVGAPCGVPAPCPPTLRCEVRRQALVLDGEPPAEPLVLVSARARARDRPELVLARLAAVARSTCD
jgi:hypothetical protein